MKKTNSNRLTYWLTRSMRYSLLALLVMLCQNAWGSVYTGSAWDEVVDDNNRPQGITTNQQGNYVITLTEPKHLAWYAWKLRTEENNSELKKYSYADVTLGADIDMSGHSWRAIGEVGDGNHDFHGTFDGQGHTISKLVCERYNGDTYAGLFDELPASVEIKNIYFKDCQSYCEDVAGIVAGNIRETSDIKFTNLTFDNCYVSTSCTDGGIVVGRIMNCQNVVFDNITVKKNCRFDPDDGERFGGITGCLGWGDNSVTVKNSFIALKAEMKNTLYRLGGVTGYMDHGSNLDVDNCVIDIAGFFFTGQYDQAAIVGRWDGSSKPIVRRTLVVGNHSSNKDLPSDHSSALFGGYTGSLSQMELYDCFIDHNHSPEPRDYQIVSKPIADANRIYAYNIQNINRTEATAKEALAVATMNEYGTSFGINPAYTSENYAVSDFVLPLGNDDGRLLKFSGGKLIAKAYGGVPEAFTKPSDDIVIMAQGKEMKYEANPRTDEWITADNSTNLSDMKRTGKWEFSGIPTAKGNFDFTFSKRPVAKWISGYPAYNQTTQRVVLKWNVTSNGYRDNWQLFGKWVIYKNNAKVAEVSGDAMEWTDLTPGSGKITYEVFFVSDDFKYTKDDNPEHPTHTFDVAYSVNMEGVTPFIKNDKVVNTVNVPNAQSLNGSRLRLLRWDTKVAEETGNKPEEILKRASELTVYTTEFMSNPQKEDEKLAVTYEDNAPQATSCTMYHYMWVMDNIKDGNFKTGASFMTEVLSLPTESGIKFKEFTATKGKSTSKVSLKWSVENDDNISMKYVIYRNIYDKNDNSTPDAWTQIYETNSGLASGSFDDETLPGYVYKYCIRAYPFCEGTSSKMNIASEMYDIGFAASRGTIQGRVTFNSGKVNVEGVDVRLQAEDDELATSMLSYAVQFTETSQYMPLAEGLNKEFWDGDWTLQFLLRPDKDGVVANLPGRMQLTLKENKLCLKDNDISIKVNAMTFEGNYVMLKHTGNGYQLGNIAFDNNDKAMVNWTGAVSDADMAKTAGNLTERDTLYFGCKGSSFSGYVDEIRLWKGELSDKSICDTYNRYLSGNEKSLMAYYTFDSGVGEYAFDSSHPSGNWNNRHSALPASEKECPIVTADFVPEADVLTYRGTTDKNGEYTISGIPFEGEGTNWQIVPSFGSHDFSPTSSRRLISATTLVHSGIDFTDISSFKVQGRVYYENTNIPVQGCNIMIDGTMVQEGTTMAETDADGAFSVDVPIGTHTLAMSMNGHTFTDSLTMYFNKAVKDLWFFDNTTAVVAGRICGGELQYAQPIGLAASKNNIGTAYITLKPSNDNYYFTAKTDKANLYIVPSDEQITYANPLKYTNDSWAHTGKAVSDTDMGDANRIYIKTDSLTGEFAASLPPMRYEVIDITIPSADEDINTKLKQKLSFLDARNTTQEQVDSVWNGQTTSDGVQVFDKFTYNTLYKEMITTPATLEVWQVEEDKTFFGEDSLTYINSDGKETAIAAYQDGKYTISAEGAETRPVFKQFENYVFYLRASQKYLNKDDSKDIVEDVMPMAYKPVTINNGMAYENYWYVDENGTTSFEEMEGIEFTLDSLGCGVYKFKTGTPNTAAPFEETISMDLDYGLDQFNLTGVLLGTVSYGNSFVTQGPSLVSMILRDPPGSNSYATWTKGSTVTTGYRKTSIDEKGNGDTAENWVGHGSSRLNIVTAAIESWSIMVGEEQTGLYLSGDNSVNGWTTTTTTTRDISTSSAPEFDGPDADLFIGNSTNIVSGNGKEVALIKNGDGVKLGLKDVKTSAFTYGTSFIYSQYQVKKSVIPNLLAERRKLIEDPATIPADSSLHYVPIMKYDEWMALTDEEKDAELDKGIGEGYHVHSNVEQYATDSVELYRLWVENWKSVLRGNEKAKDDAYSGNYLKNNYTFDAASSQTITTTTNKMKIINDETDVDGYTGDYFFGVKSNFSIMQADLEVKDGYHRTTVSRTETRNYTEEENQEVMSITLADGDANDILTVDHMTAPDGFGDIFRTRAGQTSAFWAPQYVTEYYNPGTEIMAPTLMVNKPRLELVDPTQQIVSNVRRGTSAAIQFRIINDSETKTSGYYRMCLEAENNKNGAVCTVNGNVLNNDGVGFWLEYGSPKIVTVNVAEPQSTVDDSYNLNFYLIDDKQTLPTGPMGIYPSTVTVQVNFVKSSSEINLATDELVINAESIKKGDGKVHFTLKDYDVKMDNLLYIDLQQWDGTRFMSLGESARWQKKDGLPESVNYILDMSDPNNFPDGEYKFRARTVSNYGEGEIEAYSDEIVILKDVSAPQPISNLMPVRGVLGNDNEISVEFNEDIVGDIRKNTNVELYGEMTNNSSARETSVYFNGGTDVVSTDIPIRALQKGTARSFNLWLKWTGNAGTIFTLGANSSKSRFGIDQSGHFAIIINTKQYRSETVFEKDKWTFLSIIIDGTEENENGSMAVTASYILEDGKDVVWLMGDKNEGLPVTGLATTAAPLFLGTGFHGNIQDFSMWDGVRDMDTSNNEKSLKKTRFTPNLLAYWPLNEGYGKMAKEVVSEQNMYLTSEHMWSIENNNYAMRLDKGQKAQLIFSNVNTNDDEDYLLQAWFSVDDNDGSTGSPTDENENEGVATLVSYPNGTTSFVMSKKTGNLVLKCKNDSIVLGDKNIADGYWHQLSFMVKKSENGNATVYLDGNNVGQIAAKKVDTMQGLLFLGDDDNFSGYFDEIRIWNGLQNSQAISESLSKRYSTTDCPVAAYFPFEVSGENQAVDFSLANYGSMKAKGDTVKLVVTDPNIPIGQLVIAQETENIAPLKSVPTLVTRDFSIASSERKIRINIDEKEIRNVQGTTVTALVRGLHDKAGNIIQDIRWSFLVEMNDIDWGEIVTVDYNQELHGDHIGSAKIVNNTGTEQSWRIDNVPYWMVLSCYGGVLKPSETLTLSISAKENIPVGTNSGILSLVDSKGMYHKQPYTINHIPNAPEWEVDSLYAQVMTVTGQVRINRVVQENSLSKLAAFNNLGNCVGVACPKYVKEKNSYYYTMMIHGNDWYVGKELTFKFYDATNGIYYASVKPTQPIEFGGDYANIGSIENPIYWDTTGNIEQVINISEGWNWISFNIREESPVEEVFSNPQPSTLNPQPSSIYTEVKDKNNFARYYNGKWEYDADFETITHSKMYKVKAEGSATITRIGTPINQSGSRIGIVGMTNGNPGWSWIGANVSTNMALTTAMGGLTSQATVGDIIKNHNQFAEYTTSGWIGDLNTIIPGKGYMYMSNDETKKYLIYPNNSNGVHSKERSASAQDDDQYAEYGGSATVIAAVESDGIRMDGCKIYAVDAEGNIHGCKAVSDKNGNHLAYLVVHGNEPETIKFRVETSGPRGEVFESTTTLDYSDGLSIGTSDEPFIINITGATGIRLVSPSNHNPQPSQYDLSGRPVSEGTTLNRGVYIRNNKKEFVK